MRDGVRQTPADHYLDPALSRDNLTLRTGVRVDRLVLDGTRATGLVVLDEGTGQRETLDADHVILCLGTYQSPAVLLRSGVGPADAIVPHGIAMAHELLALYATRARDEARGRLRPAGGSRLVSKLDEAS